jgi:uncharacterized protein with GYD domain
MPRYVTLTKFPPEILQNLSSFPQLLDEVTAEAETATGCVVVGNWLTLNGGPYDHVAVLDAPDEAAIVQWVNIGVAASGVDSIFFRAFTPKESAAALGVED